MTDPAPNTVTPNEALSRLMGAALDVPPATDPPKVPARATGSLQGIEKPLTAATHDVLAERQRQISVEGWGPERDDTYRHGELASAAASYAQCAGLQGEGATTENAFKEPFAENWPWSEAWWKPSAEPRRNLVKAGALILAEIERLDRAATNTNHEGEM